MHVGKWGNSLAIRLPATVVDALDLKEGDDIQVEIAADRTFRIARPLTRADALAQIETLSRPLPPGFRFVRGDEG